MPRKVKNMQNYPVVRIGEHDWYTVEKPAIFGKPWHLRRNGAGFVVRYALSETSERVAFIEHNPSSPSHHPHMLRARLSTVVEWAHLFVRDALLGERPVLNACCRGREQQAVDHIGSRRL